MDRVFKLNNVSRYNFRQISQIFRYLLRPVYYGTEINFYFGSKLWDILPDDYKTIDNLDTNQIKIKQEYID